MSAASNAPFAYQRSTTAQIDRALPSVARMRHSKKLHSNGKSAMAFCSCFESLLKPGARFFNQSSASVIVYLAHFFLMSGLHSGHPTLSGPEYLSLAQLEEDNSRSNPAQFERRYGVRRIIH